MVNCSNIKKTFPKNASRGTTMIKATDIHTHLKDMFSSHFPKTMGQWNSLLFSAVFGSVLIFGIPALVSSVRMALNTGYYINLVIYIAVYLFILSLILFRRIPFRLRAWAGVFLFVLLGILALLTLGPVGSGRVWLFTAAVLSALLLGLKASMMVLSVILGTIIYLTVRVSAGTIQWELAELYSPNTWTTTSITFLFLCIISTISLGLLVRGLRLLHQQSEHDRQELYETTINLENEIRRHQDTLHALQEREELLRQAQKMEAIGLLAGGIAHDLNNILTPIIGYGEILLLDTDKTDPKYEHINEVRDAGSRAKNIVRQLLAFARKQTLEVKNVDLNHIIRNFQTLIRRSIREDIEIVHQLAEPLPLISADVGQMEQILMNLHINAQDAMSKGGILTVKTSSLELNGADVENRGLPKPGRYIMLTVKDNGQGMDHETLQHIFDPFFTTKTHAQGTGLGLATVYGIVKQHNGDIQADSEPGKGTVFTLLLPAIENHNPEKVSLTPEPESINGDETILVVEDNETVKKLAEEALKWYGYTVFTASGVKECLRILKDQDCPAQLIITDVIMPEMNGKELFETIKTICPHMKVIFMSGHTDDVILHQGVLDESIHFIQKPFKIESLARKVRTVLDEK